MDFIIKIDKPVLRLRHEVVGQAHLSHDAVRSDTVIDLCLGCVPAPVKDDHVAFAQFYGTGYVNNDARKYLFLSDGVRIDMGQLRRFQRV